VNVYERVHAVLSDLPAIGKDSTAPTAMGGYKFRGIEAITGELKPLLAKHGVIMVPTVTERVESERKTSGGKALYCVDLKVRFTFYGVDNDENKNFEMQTRTTSFDAEVWGQGTDSGDKATQKAMTSAFKSMLAITFCISDSENDAERHDVPDSMPHGEKAPAAKAERIVALATDIESFGNDDFREWVADEFKSPWTEGDCDDIEAALAPYKQVAAK
jgi:hypothetical protein